MTIRARLVLMSLPLVVVLSAVLLLFFISEDANRTTLTELTESLDEVNQVRLFTTTARDMILGRDAATAMERQFDRLRDRLDPAVAQAAVNLRKLAQDADASFATLSTLEETFDQEALKLVLEPDQANRLYQLGLALGRPARSWSDLVRLGILAPQLLEETKVVFETHYEIEAILQRAQGELDWLDSVLASLALSPADGELIDQFRRSVGVLYQTIGDYVQTLGTIAQFQNQANGAIQTLDQVLAETVSTLVQASYAQQSDQLSTVIAVVSILMGLSIIMAIFMGRSIVRPLKRTTQLFQSIAQGEGDLTLRLPSRRRDEIGQLAQYFNEFAGSLESLVATMKRVVVQNDASTEELEQQSLNLASAFAQVTQLFAQISERFDSLTTTIYQGQKQADVIRRNAAEIDRHTNQESEYMSEASAAIDQLVASIDSLKSLMARKLSSAEALAQRSQDGLDQLEANDATIAAMADKLDAVGEAIEVISSVAKQTNLLAMNAAIEAAHAGEQGKGFAVVADQIRTLAEATGENARQISTSLEEMAARVTDAQTTSKDTGQVVGEVLEGVKALRDAFEEIAGNMNEQSDASHSIATSTHALYDETKTVKEEMGLIYESLTSLQGVHTQAVSYALNGKASVDQFKKSLGLIGDAIDSMNNAGQQSREHSSLISNSVGAFKVSEHLLSPAVETTATAKTTPRPRKLQGPKVEFDPHLVEEVISLE